jgi:hypothetical protein
MENVIRNFIEENWEAFVQRANEAGFEDDEIEPELEKFLIEHS